MHIQDFLVHSPTLNTSVNWWGLELSHIVLEYMKEIKLPVPDIRVIIISLWQK